MIVIADTSPINYLILIEQVQVLHILYGRVIIPPAVAQGTSARPGTGESTSLDGTFSGVA